MSFDPIPVLLTFLAVIIAPIALGIKHIAVKSERSRTDMIHGRLSEIRVELEALVRKSEDKREERREGERNRLRAKLHDIKLNAGEALRKHGYRDGADRMISSLEDIRKIASSEEPPLEIQEQLEEILGHLQDKIESRKES